MISLVVVAVPFWQSNILGLIPETHSNHLSKPDCTQFLFECAPVSDLIRKEIIRKLGVNNRPMTVSHQTSKFTQFPMLSVDLFLSETQDSCAPAVVIQLCLHLAHSGQSIMCGGFGLGCVIVYTSTAVSLPMSSCVYNRGKSCCRAVTLIRASHHIPPVH